MLGRFASPISAKFLQRPTRKSPAINSPASPRIGKRARRRQAQAGRSRSRRNRRQSAHRSRRGRRQPTDPGNLRSAGFPADARAMTVGEFREHLLDDATGAEEIRQVQPAIVPEIAAAAAKIMSNKDLVLAAAKIRNVTRCRTPWASWCAGHSHSAEPSGGRSGRDSALRFEGLLYGCGDAVIGVNPASDSVETTSAILHALRRLVDVYAAPTQTCCLAHITTQLAALNAARRWICCFSRSPGPKRRTTASASRWQCCARAASACWNTIAAVTCLEGRERDVFRDRPGQRAFGRSAPRRRSGDARSARLRCGARASIRFW